jgi:hypothetical protein
MATPTSGSAKATEERNPAWPKARAEACAPYPKWSRRAARVEHQAEPPVERRVTPVLDAEPVRCRGWAMVTGLRISRARPAAEQHLEDAAQLAHRAAAIAAGDDPRQLALRVGRHSLGWRGLAAGVV